MPLSPGDELGPREVPSPVGEASRSVRVFVSSTFRDMHEERDHLVNIAFPQIRTLCEKRGVTLAEIDLRWGIMGEDSNVVLPDCLDEVDRCRPFFVGLLGERYGCVPETLPEEMLDRFSWLEEHRYKSITELEMIYGVLREGSRRSHAFFYFRDPGFLDHLRSDCTLADFESETPDAHAKLLNLKQRIREAGIKETCEVRENFHDPDELGQWIIEDFSRLINKLFPEENADPIAAAHAQFAATRRRIWVGREVELERLNEIMAERCTAVVIGPRGMGQSAFLANWAAAWRETHPTTLVIEHYVGADSRSTSLEGCCRQLCLALASGQGRPPPIAAVQSEWPDLFIEYLALAGRAGDVLLVIDAADRLQGRGLDLGADWLLDVLPDGVQIVTSAGESAAVLAENRNWPVLRLEGLSAADRATFIKRYFAIYGKMLSPEHIQQITSSHATTNLFYLTLLLEELRQHGNNEVLGGRLSELLAAPDVLQISNLIFTRAERDCDRNFPSFTARALGFLATASFGLGDNELCELFGGPQGRLPQRPWSNLQLSLRQMLVFREGLVGFAQSEMKVAAQHRYVPTSDDRRALHRQLADYFLARPSSPRAADELPFHFAELKAWDELADWLSLPDAFKTAWELAPEEVCKVWAAVEKHWSRRAAITCEAFPQALGQQSLHLLRQLGHWTDALRLARKALRAAQVEGDASRECETLIMIGEVELEAGSLHEAQEVFSMSEERATALQDNRAALRALRGKAQAIRRLIQEHRSNVFTRAELSRQLRIVRDRATQIAEAAEDEVLQAGAQLIWLEDLVAQGISLRDIAVGVEAVRASVRVKSTSRGSNVADRLERQVDRAKSTLRDRLTRIEAATKNFRFTRHRGLAVRAEVALATMQNDQERLWSALAALRQYADMHGDYKLMASVHGEAAGQSVGDARLYYLRQQEFALESAGDRAALVRNWWQQAEVLWPELGRSENALALIRRVVEERSVFSTRIDRLKLQAYRIRLLFRLDEKRLRLLLRFGVWIFGPLWIWCVWRGVRWAIAWFPQITVAVIACYLVAFVAIIGPTGILLSEFFHGLRLIRSKFRQTIWAERGSSDRTPSPPPDNELEPIKSIGAAEISPEACDSALTHANVPSTDPLASQATAPQLESAEEPKIELPAWIGSFVRFYMRGARIGIRSQRIGHSLHLDRLPARLAWCALALPPGVVLTMCAWGSSGWTRTLTLPLGLFGQLLILDALFGLFWLLVFRPLARRRSSLPSRAGSPMSFACMLAMIRLRRRFLGRRRPRGRRPG